MNDEMLSLSFDAERARLIAVLCLVLLSAAVSGMLCLRRSAAWLSGTFVFVAIYLWPFLQQAQHPPLGPDDRPEALLPGALATAALTLLAIGSLVAALGAILGEAAGQLVFPSLAALGARLVARARGSAPPARVLTLRQATGSLALTALVAIALWAAAPGIATYLTFGVSSRLYQPRVLVNQPIRLKGAVLQSEFVSQALGGMTRRFSIYLPPSYPTSQNQRYPTIYLLHGAPGDDRNWFEAGHADTSADALIAAGLMRQTIIVAPDGNGPVYRVSAWVNSFDHRQRMEDAIAFDLVHYIDGHFRTIADAEHRVIGGLSDGAFGAANIGLHHPDLFGRVVCLSGYFVADHNLVFGTRPANASYRALNSPSIYVQTPLGQSAARRLSFVIGVGTADGMYYADAVAFIKQLSTLGARVRHLEMQGGHSWTLWSQEFARTLRMLEPVPSWGPDRHQT